MKKIINIAVLAFGMIASTTAQTIYDGVKFTQKDLNGTARFVGMGGAMGALGGDVSTMGVNPAGIGIYRSNDVMTTFGFSAYGSESSYGGNKFNIDKSRMSFDNIGFVFSSKIGNQTALRYVNFGFNYTRSKSLDKYMSMEGLINLGANNAIVSQTDQMAGQANDMGENIHELDASNVNLFTDSYVGWLAATGWKSDLYEYNGTENSYNGFLGQPYSWFNSREKGGINQYDFNVSFNLNDRVYLGLTVGAYDVNYSKYSTYGEDFGNHEEGGVNYGNESYEMSTENKIDGSGVDFKFGAIVRPFEDSPFRLGVAIHTPTFYNLTMKTNVRAISSIYSPDQKKVLDHVVDSYSFTNNNDYGYDLRLRTPWKYNLSLGYTIGSNFAIGAEYEYQDYSGMHFSYSNGDEMKWENSTAKEMLKGVNTFRVGAELKVVPEFAFRLGYNYISSAFENRAFKDLAPNSINTDTDFANAKAQSNYTLGIGYRGSSFYADLAYLYSSYKDDFYAFHNNNGYLDRTKVTNTRSKVLLTLGLRF
ncbi:TonB-dependent receptor [Bacteroides reticulotermitis]|uniref:TonB-dependent receptor n=1 Tax=Bacteroides reticulotermitis TaxID=1133319 RepID=UPI003A83C96F